MSRAERIEALKQAAKERILILDGSWPVLSPFDSTKQGIAP